MRSLDRLCITGIVTLAILAALTTSGPAVAADATKAPEVAKMTADQLARLIDQALEERIKSEKVTHSPPASDAEFLRRVYLDLAGKVPSPEKAIAFLDSKDAGKRARLIDELLAGKDFGRHEADVWQALLLPRTTETRRLMQYFPSMVTWLEGQFNNSVGWDRIAKGVLTASGPVDKPGPAVYWLANPTADKATDNVTRMFMGVQLQCAQCHNHPFTSYKQNEYWHMAAFFLKVRPDGNPRMAARTGATISISEGPGQVNRRRLPPSAKLLPPKFLGGEQPKVRTNQPVRPVLADWLTSPKNPFFARAMVNRTWAQLFGRGFVQPIDDMHDGNPNSHPELLTEMSRQFAASGFDVKYLFRAICNSQAYQRDSKPAGNNLEAAPELFARMAIRPLTPAQLYDSLNQVLGDTPLRGGGRPAGGGGRAGGSPREAFIASFGIEDGADPTEYQAGIPQVLRLMNAPQLNRATAIAPLLREGKSQSEIVERLYLTVLSRRPTAEEALRIAGYLQKNRDDRRQAYAGVQWALMNSSEFAVNR